MTVAHHPEQGNGEPHYSTEGHDALRLAAAAGAALQQLQRHWPATVGPAALRTCGDRVSHALLMRLLNDLYPADAILSEEGKDDPVRLRHERVWIVDPLDGTREFSEGRDDWAVHVALVVRGVPVVGAVAMPALEATFGTVAPRPLPAPHGGSPRMVVSRTRAPQVAHDLARALGADLIEMGSAGAKTMAVLRGEADLYVHAGGQYEWDSAAPVAVALAAGLHASRLDGSPLRYNEPNPWLPDQLVCRPDLAEPVLSLLAGML